MNQLQTRVKIVRSEVLYQFEKDVNKAITDLEAEGFTIVKMEQMGSATVYFIHAQRMGAAPKPEGSEIVAPNMLRHVEYEYNYLDKGEKKYLGFSSFKEAVAWAYKDLTGNDSSVQPLSITAITTLTYPTGDIHFLHEVMT